MRLDLFLKTNLNIKSRNKASELIKAKKIQVDGKIIEKSSFIVDVHCKIVILEDVFYVSRSAYKLKLFLDDINIDFTNLNALDIGSSTGGFTQILLEKNIKSVSCVDVGSNQLDDILKKDKKITFFENTDIRKFNSSKKFDIITCDVSFISILYIIEHINLLALNNIIILFKAQFEVGFNVKRNTKGVVLDKHAISKARLKFLNKCKLLKWNLIYNAKSKIQGKNGNEEEFFYFNK